MSTPLLEQVATMKRRYASKIKTLKQQNALLNTKLDDQDVLIKGMAASPPSAAAHPLEARKKALLEKLNSTHKGIAEKVKTKRSLQRGALAVSTVIDNFFLKRGVLAQSQCFYKWEKMSEEWRRALAAKRYKLLAAERFSRRRETGHTHLVFTAWARHVAREKYKHAVNGLVKATATVRELYKTTKDASAKSRTFHSSMNVMRRQLQRAALLQMSGIRRKAVLFRAYYTWERRCRAEREFDIVHTRLVRLRNSRTTNYHFRKWMRNAMLRQRSRAEDVRNRANEARASRKFCTIVLSRSMRAWKRFNTLLRKTGRFILRLERLGTKLAFQMWRKEIEERIRLESLVHSAKLKAHVKKTILRRAVSKYYSRVLSRGMQGWKACVQRLAAIQDKIAAIAARKQCKCLSTALRAFSLYAHHEKTKHDKEDRALAFCSRHMLRRPWCGWKQAVHKQQAARKKILCLLWRTFEKVRNVRLQSAWQRWWKGVHSKMTDELREAAQRAMLRQKQSVLRAFCRRSKIARLSSAFVPWRNAFLHSKRTDKILRKVINRLGRQKVAKCFEALHAQCKKQIAEKQAAETLFHGIERLRLSECCKWWKQHVSQRKRMRERFLKLRDGWHRCTVRSAWSRFLAVQRILARENAAFCMKASGVKLAKFALIRLGRRKLRDGWEAWKFHLLYEKMVTRMAKITKGLKSQIDETARRKDKYKHKLASYAHDRKIRRSIQTYFSNWDKLTRKQAKQRRRVRQYQARRKKSWANRIFSHLVKFSRTSCMRKHRVVALVQRRIRNYLLAAFYKIMAAENNESYQADHANELVMTVTKHRKASAKRLFLRAFYLKRFSAFSTWKFRVASARRLQYKSTKILKRWKRLEFANIWNLFVRNISIFRQERMKLTRVVHYMTQRLKVRSWSTWVSVTRTRKRAMSIIRNMQRAKLTNEVQQQKVRAIRQWYRCTTYHKWNEMGEIQRCLALGHRQSVTRRVFGRLKQKQTSLGFQAWASFIQVSKRRDTILHRSLARLQHATLYRVFSTWATMAQVRKRNRHHIFIVRQRMQLRLASKSVLKWKSIVRTRRSLRRFILARMGNKRKGCMTEAWNTLREIVRLHRTDNQIEHLAAIKFKRLVRQNAVKHLLTATKKRRLSLGFRLWTKRALQLHSIETFRVVLIQRASKYTKIKVLANWKSYVQLTRFEFRKQNYYDSMLSPIIRRMKKHIIASTFHTWKSSVKRSLRNKRVVLVCRQKRVTNRLESGYQAFFANRQRRSRVRRTVSICFSRKIRTNLQLAFKMLQLVQTNHEDVEKAIAQRKLAKRVLMRGYQLKLSKSMSSWKLYSKWHSIMEKKKGNILRRWKRMELGVAFETFRQRSQEQMSKRKILAEAVNIFRHTTIFRSWGAWRKMVKARVKLRCIVVRLQSRKNRGIREHLLRRGWNTWNKALNYLKFEILSLSQRNMVIEYRRGLLKKVYYRATNRQLYSALHKWHTTTKEIARVEHVCSQVVKRIQFRSSSRAYEAWKTFVRVRKHNRHAIFAVQQQMKHHHVIKAYRSWLGFIQWRKSQRNHVLSLLVSLKRRRVDAAFAHWYTKIRDERRREVEESIQTKTKRRAWCTLCRLKNKKLSTAFAKWTHNTEWERMTETKIRVTIKRWQRLQLKTVFDTFRQNVHNALRDRLKMESAASKMLNGALHAVWNTWKAYTGKRKRARIIVKKMRHRKLTVEYARQLNRGWRRWTKFVGALKLNEMSRAQRNVLIGHRQSIINRVLRHTRYAKQSAALNKWWVSTKDLRRYEAIVHKVRERLVHSLASRAFNAWTNFMGKIRDQRRVVRKVCNMIYYNGMSLAWHKWNRVKSYQRETHRFVLSLLGNWKRRMADSAFTLWYLRIRQIKAAETAEREMSLKRRRTRVTILRLLQKKVSSAFNKWVDHNNWWSLFEIRRERAVNRWRRLDLSSAFILFCKRVRESIDNRVKKIAAVARIVHTVKFSAWTSWKAFCERRFMARRVILKMRSKKARAQRDKRLRRGWITWIKLVAGRNAMELGAAHREFVATYQRRLMKKTFLRFSKRALATAFMNWWRQAEREKRCETLMQKSSLRLKHGLQFRAFRGWHTFSQTLKVNRNALLRAQRRIQHRYLFKAWNTLLDFSQKHRESMLSCAKLLNTFKRRRVDIAFSTWHKKIRLERAHEAAQKARESECFHIRATLLRILHGKLNAALTTWKLHNRYFAIIDRKKTRALRRWTKTRLSNAFLRFHTNVKNRRNSREKLSRALNTMMLGQRKRLLSSILWKWETRVGRRLRARKIISRMQSKKISAERERRIQRGWNVLLRWCVASKTKEMSDSQQQALVTHQRRVLHRFAKHMKSKDLSWGFKRWIYYAKHRARYVNMITRVHRRIRQNLVDRAFYGWVSFLRGRKRKKHLIHIVRQRVQHHTTSRAFGTWEDFAARRRSKRAQVLDMLMKVRQRATGGAFKIWNNAVQHERNVETKAAALIHRMKNMNLAKCFGSWVAGVKRRRRIEAIHAIMNDKDDYQHRRFSVDMSTGFLAWKKMYELQLKDYGWDAQDVVECINDLGAMSIFTSLEIETKE
jgi:hypothetical protein